MLHKMLYLCVCVALSGIDWSLTYKYWLFTIDNIFNVIYDYLKNVKSQKIKKNLLKNIKNDLKRQTPIFLKKNKKIIFFKDNEI